MNNLYKKFLLATHSNLALRNSENFWKHEITDDHPSICNAPSNWEHHRWKHKILDEVYWFWLPCGSSKRESFKQLKEFWLNDRCKRKIRKDT